MREKYVIYCIKNLVNNKIYIGQSVNLDGRWYHHKWMLRNNLHSNVHLQHAWNKDGEKSFEFSILEYVHNENDLTTREQYYIDLYNGLDPDFGYNLKEAGDTGKLSIEARMRISTATKGRTPWNKGRHHSKESIEKMKQNRAGKGCRSVSQEVRDKLSEALKTRYKYEKHPMLGRNHSEETKHKLSLSHMGDKNPMFGKKHSIERLKQLSANSNGESNPSAKLNEGSVCEIYSRYKSGEKPSILAREFNVSKSTIFNIISGKTWTNVTRMEE